MTKSNAGNVAHESQLPRECKIFRRVRAKRKATQVNVAKYLNISQNAIVKWERKGTNPLSLYGYLINMLSDDQVEQLIEWLFDDIGAWQAAKENQKAAFRKRFPKYFENKEKRRLAKIKKRRVKRRPVSSRRRKRLFLNMNVRDWDEMPRYRDRVESAGIEFIPRFLNLKLGEDDELS